MAGKEAALQGKIIRWLKAKGCYVIKTQASPGTPTGCPDIIALFPGGGWAALEVKADEKARFQPLQKITVEKLNYMYYSRVVYENNWNRIKNELESII